MNCSYKEIKSGCTKPWCKFTGGECQFTIGDYDMRLCPLHSDGSVPTTEKVKVKVLLSHGQEYGVDPVAEYLSVGSNRYEINQQFEVEKDVEVSISAMTSNEEDYQWKWWLSAVNGDRIIQNPLTMKFSSDTTLSVAYTGPQSIVIDVDPTPDITSDMDYPDLEIID